MQYRVKSLPIDLIGDEATSSYFNQWTENNKQCSESLLSKYDGIDSFDVFSNHFNLKTETNSLNFQT